MVKRIVESKVKIPKVLRRSVLNQRSEPRSIECYRRFGKQVNHSPVGSM